MAGHSDDDDAGFWPGYVAAVSGLVQGLLIMAMALGVSIFALSQVGIKGKLPGDGPQGLPRAPAPLPPPQEQAPPLPEAPPAARPMRISFLGDAVLLPPSVRKLVGSAIENRQAMGVARWQIELTADLEDPRARRAGYLRVMGVRSLLMSAGIPAEAIDVRLLDGVAEGEGEGASAVIVSPLAYGAPPALLPPPSPVLEVQP